MAAGIQEVRTENIEARRDISTEETHGLAVAVDKLEISMKNMVSELPGEPLDPRLVTIFRLPSSIHENNKELCEPHLVAIGPIHHGKESLRTMEEHKWYIFRDFLARNKNVGLKDYLQAMRSIEAEARHFYSESVDLGSDDFVTMLLLDGCFILNWFFLKNISVTDVMFDLGWAAITLFPDLCLLENQVPFFVLHKLWDIQNRPVWGAPNCEDHIHCPLLELFCPVLAAKFYFTQFKPPQISCSNIHHLLHLCYLGVVPDPDSKPQTQWEKKNSSASILHKFCHSGSFLWSKLYSGNERSDWAPKIQQQLTIPCISELHDIQQQLTIPCISELHDAGVKFRRKKRPASLFDISFENGTIEMPFLIIDAPKIRMLWNMVAFEQSRRPWDLPATLSSYLALMDTLINTEKDVAILERFGIFGSLCQNSEEAANFFNQFERFFVLDHSNHYFYELFKDVRQYSQSTWHRYRARLMQEYFNNPWTIISVVAAGILLILTVLQTYYSAAE